MWNHMNGYIGEHGWGWMLFGALHMIAFWAIVIGVVWLLVRAFGSSAEYRRAERTPLDILKERYARGEIDKAEYEQRKADLER